MNFGPQLNGTPYPIPSPWLASKCQDNDKEKSGIIMPCFHSQIHSFFWLTHHLDLVQEAIFIFRLGKKKKKDELAWLESPDGTKNQFSNSLSQIHWQFQQV